MSEAADDRPIRPTCPCHGWGACVHRIGGRLNPNEPDPVGGVDWARNLQWHCMVEPCENYSLRWLVPVEGWHGDPRPGTPPGPK